MDEDAPIKKRWRLLAWSGAAVILLPVLYVAASGPLMWWGRYEFQKPRWYGEYRHSLRALDRFAEFKVILRTYQSWWIRLPAPRSWRRQYLVDQFARRQKIVEDLLAARTKLEAEADALRTRLDALEAQASSPHDIPAEAVAIRLRLNELGRARGRIGSPLAPVELRNLPNHEANALNAEAELRRFDAQ